MTNELDQATLDFAHQMFELARSGKAELLAEMVDKGLPVNLTNDKGDTLLILAAYHVHLETVVVLLDRGADVERMNDKGQTALGSAVFRQAAAVVTALLAAGARADTGKPSALEVARFFELPQMTELLRARTDRT